LFVWEQHKDPGSIFKTFPADTTGVARPEPVHGVNGMDAEKIRQ
jgi:hypothetical protein